MRRSRFVLAEAVFLLHLMRRAPISTAQTASGCANSCSGHGTCDKAGGSPTYKCTCFDGFGSDMDIADYKAPDCSLRTCPYGRRWFDIAQTTTSAHRNAECSGIGDCNRASGVCLCPSGYEGKACNLQACPGQCSGHGRCLSMSEIISEAEAQPLRSEFTWAYPDDATANTWDASMVRGCLCDSSWTVGLDAGETQVAEWYGPDCSLRRCPSGDDLWTTVDETDCSGKYDNGALTAATKTVAHSQIVVSNTVAITNIVVASGSTTTATCTHAAAAGFLAVGDTVTVSGYTGDANSIAVNQDYVVTSITSATETVLTGTGLTVGTYSAGGSQLLTYDAKATCTHSSAVRSLAVGDAVTVSGHTGSVSITQILVAGGSTTVAICTHAALTEPLAVGDTITVSGHADSALNQDYVVASVTSATETVLTGTGLTAGTYTAGSSKLLTYNPAVNQQYFLTHIESATVVVMSGTGLTVGTYTTGTSKLLTYSISAKGNLCHVECANRGLCDSNTGVCECFDGWYGSACTNRRTTPAIS